MGQPQKEVILLDQSGFPFMFELTPSESQVVIRIYQSKTTYKVKINYGDNPILPEAIK